MRFENTVLREIGFEDANLQADLHPDMRHYKMHKNGVHVAYGMIRFADDSYRVEQVCVIAKDFSDSKIDTCRIDENGFEALQRIYCEHFNNNSDPNEA